MYMFVKFIKFLLIYFPHSTYNIYDNMLGKN